MPNFKKIRVGGCRFTLFLGVLRWNTPEVKILIFGHLGLSVAKFSVVEYGVQLSGDELSCTHGCGGGTFPSRDEYYL